MTTKITARPTPGAEVQLRKVLRINTALSASTGLIGLIFGEPVADLLGVDQIWLVRLLGAGLLGFAAVVFLVARSSQPMLHRWSLEISLADFGWVLGTIAGVALGWLSTGGIAVMAIIAAAVLALGLAQYHHRTQMITLDGG